MRVKVWYEQRLEGVAVLDVPDMPAELVEEWLDDHRDEWEEQADRYLGVADTSYRLL
ncbi:hypothetical protein BEUL_1264 [Bifidobacterium eulemuris]|nr:hypothetical protein [Bifidobacterium eulemuris]OZG68251.1 hypothetical protein BEUL_1264 [Bifidobacterium eulemuris]